MGVSHQTAPVAFRERLALLGTQAAELLTATTGHPVAAEAVTLATCNRTELYLAVTDPDEGERVALAALARRAGVLPAALRRHETEQREVSGGKRPISDHRPDSQQQGHGGNNERRSRKE